MPWLQYEVMEVDPDAYAEWEATPAPPVKEGEEPKPKDPPPEPESVTKTIEFGGEARMIVSGPGGYQNISLSPGGVTKVEVLEEDPNPSVEESAPKASTSKASSSSSS